MIEIVECVYTKIFSHSQMSRRVVKKKIQEPDPEAEPANEEMELDERSDESSFVDSDETDSEPEVILNILERQPRITAGM